MKRMLSMLLGGILVAAVVLAGGAPIARACARTDSSQVSMSMSLRTDAGGALAAQRGTLAEARDYERREEASVDVRDFAGGDAVIGVSVGLVVLALVVIFVVWALNR